MTQNNISRILPNVSKAISELSASGIVGVVYYFQKGECSCCYGAKGVFFEIEGNTAENQGWHGADINQWRVRFEHDQKKADAVAKSLRKHLRASGYGLEWSGEVSACMFIKPNK